MSLMHVLSRAARRTGRVFEGVRSIPNKLRIVAKDWQDRREIAATAVAVPTVRERQEQLIAFYQRYEGLVELLVDSAQYGPDQRLEGKYQEQRLWMQSHYPPLRRYVVAYLAFDPADSNQSIELQGRGADAFEALFAAPTLSEFLRCDDGHMISRIMRTREALTLYGEHLRRLAA